MSWFHVSLSSRTDFEVVQAYMHRFLKLHSEVIAENDALKEQAEVSRAERRARAARRALPSSAPSASDLTPAPPPPPPHRHRHRATCSHTTALVSRPTPSSTHQELAEAQREAGRHVRELLQQNLCLIKFFCNAQVV